MIQTLILPPTSRHHRIVPLLGVWAIALPLLAASTGAAHGSPGAPSDAVQAELPPDHPPLSAAPTPGTSVLPPIPDGSGRGAEGLTWEVPAGWKPEPPSSSMRRAQYRVPPPTPSGDPAADAECVVFYFGPNQGGDAAANAERWAGQFSRSDGSPARPDLVTREIEAHGLSALWVEIAGTYDGGMRMGPGPRRSFPGSRLLGAIVAGPDANWFFKMVGPDATVSAQRDAFERMIRSLRTEG